MVKCENHGKKLGFANRRGDKAKSFTEIERIPHSNGFTGYLPEGAALEVVINVVRAIGASKKTIATERLMHSRASGPGSNERLKKAHTNVRLTLPKNRGKDLVPISRKNEMERNIQFKSLENLGFDFKLDIVCDF